VYALTAPVAHELRWLRVSGRSGKPFSACSNNWAASSGLPAAKSASARASTSCGGATQTGLCERRDLNRAEEREQDGERRPDHPDQNKPRVTPPTSASDSIRGPRLVAKRATWR
jgi:hypothetical protein